MATISERAAAAISAVEQGAAPDNPLALRLMRMVAHVAGDEETLGVFWSGEQLAVALVLDRHDMLGSYTMLEAVERIGSDWLTAARTVQRMIYS